MRNGHFWPATNLTLSDARVWRVDIVAINFLYKIMIPKNVHILISCNQDEGTFTVRHNNQESLAPRCKIKNPEMDPLKIGMDFCTTCEVSVLKLFLTTVDNDGKLGR